MVDICPHSNNRMWCPKHSGQKNDFGVHNHFDFATVPADFDNYYFEFTPEPCDHEMQSRLARMSSCHLVWGLNTLMRLTSVVPLRRWRRKKRFNDRFGSFRLGAGAFCLMKISEAHQTTKTKLWRISGYSTWCMASGYRSDKWTWGWCDFR